MSKMYVVKMETDKWLGEKGYSKIGIAIKEDKIYVEHLAGAAMKVGAAIMLPLVIREIRQELKEFLKNYKRVQEFKLEHWFGMSGCEDCVLKTRTITEAGFQDIKTRARLHISCNRKLNEGVEPMYIGDYLEIAEELLREKTEADFPIIREAVENYSIKKWRIIRKEQFKYLKVTNVWKVKEATEDGWKSPEEAI